ncbi:MAG TPA: RidA family protein [Burkholderiaceae bacterium]|nr:RidA family protein [Burkholderiaceae bacterium]
MTSITQRLAQIGHQLPPLEAPVANYLNYTFQGNNLVIAGQIGRIDATKAGLVGAGLSAEDARLEAEQAALGLLAVIDTATDRDADRVVQVLRLGVYIAASPHFDQHSIVANGASDLLVAVFGERGRHARTAIGVASLPAGAAVEVDAVVQLREPTAI